MSSKPFDIVIFGATGFTGQLVARYFLTNKETSPVGVTPLKWAIAARSQSKLDTVKQKLKEFVTSVHPDVVDKIPTIVADSSDEKALEQMVKQTKVVLTVVGPYKRYGSLLLKKCVENGVHYCDLTGEMLWVQEMISKYQKEAEKTGARIIHCCGFESIPSDMTTFLIADLMRQKLKEPAGQVNLYIADSKGGISGGTLDSVLTIFDTASNSELLQMGPFMLTNEETRKEKKFTKLEWQNASGFLPRKEKDMKKWSGYFVGASVNGCVVHRTDELLGKSYYSDKFVYRERFAMGNFFVQVAIAVGSILFGVLAYFSLTRALLRKILPAPGQGPSEEAMKEGYFVMKAFGYKENGQLAAKAETIGKGDGGYLLTSQMISEVAIGLAKKRNLRW